MLTLAEAMILPLLQEQTSKGFFGKPKIRFGSYLEVSAYIYESAALASRALIEKSSVLEQIIATPGITPGSTLMYLRNLARERRELFPEETSFGMLIMKSELNKMSLTMSTDSFEATSHALNKKVPVADIKIFAEMQCVEGFGFGLEFPDETLDIYRNAHENFDEENWKLIHESRVSIPERPTVYPLKKRENDILSLIAEYVKVYRPELRDSINLSHLLT